MKTKFITLIVALATFATVILAQQYERVVKIYKDGEILNSYLISEVDSIKFDKVALYQVGVTANNSEAGYVLINDNTTSDLFKEGESITLKAVANSGYQFVNWTLNGSVVSTNNSCSVVVNGAVTYVANFEENQLQYCTPEGTMLSSRQLNSFTLTDGTNSLSLSNIQSSTRDAVYKDKTEFYLHTQQGETLNFLEMDWTGAWMHAFVYIDYNRDGIFNTTSNPYGNNDGELVSYNFYSSDDSGVGTDSKGNVVSNSCGVYANNIPSWTIPENLESGEYRMRFKIDWESLDPCGSTDSKNSIQNNGGVVCDLTLRVGATDLLYDVTFKSTPQLAGTASVVDENFDKATLLATANAGYVFECWKINGLQISTDNPYVATISANTEIEVCFRQAETVTVSATVAKGGSVEVSNPNPLEGTEVTLTATANAGFQFESWSLNGKVVSTENPYTITARGNAEYVANFTDKYSQLTTVPTIYINTENGVAVTSKEDYVNAYVTVRGAENEEDNITEVLTEIKGRGNSTWGMAKKPYRLKFDEKIKFLGNEAKEKNWVLLANYADKTLMRNALAFETARNMMNFGFTPSVTFVDVVLNGENLGSYMLTDQVEVKKKRVPVTEQETTTTMSDAEITGGYLIEVDGFADSEISWFQTSQGMKVTIKYPKDDEINSDQSAYIANYTQNMENAMFSTNFEDAELGWRKYIDEASMVDWYIACELFGNSDSWWSTYMYKERNEVFKFGPLWDFDIAFNNDNRLGDATTLMMRTNAHEPKTWISRWWQDAGFVSAVKTRWAELRAAGLEAFMTNYITTTATYLDASQKNNFEVWNILNTIVYNELAARGSYEAEVEFLKEYVRNRIAYLDTQFEMEETICSVLATSSNNSWGTVSVSETTVNANDTVTLTATPAEGCKFVNWTIDGVDAGNENPMELVVTSTTEVKANFKEIKKTLPKVYVETPNGVAITSKEVWTEECIIRIEDEFGEEVMNTTTNFRGRGNSTWSYPKKPYAIKLDSKAEVLGMPKHKRWVLLANWMDRTLMRNAVAFEMARQIMDWAPRGEFVEFYLNGSHQGNYYLCEQIKIDKNRVNITEFEDGSATGEDGGYLLEFDTNYQAEINYFMSQVYGYPVTIKDPDEEIITEWTHPYFTYIDNYIGDVENALVDNDFETVFSKIDYSTYIDYLLIHEVTSNEEPKHPKSCYMYKDAGGKLCAGPVWDFDWGTFEPNKTGLLLTNSLWYGQLMNSAEFRTAIKARWAEIKPIFENIDTFIDEQADLIRESEAVNHEMWPIDSRHNYPNGDELMDFDSAVERMKQAIDNRIIALDSAINAL